MAIPITYETKEWEPVELAFIDISMSHQFTPPANFYSEEQDKWGYFGEEMNISHAKDAANVYYQYNGVEWQVMTQLETLTFKQQCERRKRNNR